jgi:hypothetical protein
MKEQARRETDLIVQEAHAESRRIARAAANERERLEEETRRIRAQLRHALEAIEEWPAEPEAEKPAQQQVEEVTDSGIRGVAG